MVSFRFKDGCSWDDPRARDAERITCGHPTRVPGILCWTAGRNISCRDVAYDFGLVAAFADADALRLFLDHPDHQRGVRAWQEISSWVVVDIDSGPAKGRRNRWLTAEPVPYG